MHPDTWLWSEEHRQLCKVIETQTLWGNTFYRIWLPNQDTVIRTRAEKLKPLSDANITTPASIAYIATSARIADALTQDVLLAPIESSVIPLPHQIKALSKAVSSNSVRYLLADEVGLGKTIEAGLIMRELKLRGMVKRILIVAPKGLVSQWVSEMRLHFNEEFNLILPEDLKTLQRLYPNSQSKVPNNWGLFNQVVCPMDSIKPMDKRRGWSREQLAEYNKERFEDLIAAGWDLVIVDEAHRLGGSTDQVARYKLGQGLAETAPYLLLLSATPHQGKTDAFYRLISLLDPVAFPDITSVTRERVQPYVIRTEKRRAINAQGETKLSPKVRVIGLVVDIVDKIMHGMQLGTAGMHNQVRQWAELGIMSNLLDLLLQNNFQVFLTSDHGNIEATGMGQPKEGATADVRGERVRVYPDKLLRSLVKNEFITAIEWQLGLPPQYLPLLATRRQAFIREGEKIVAHGGACMEELIVPFISVYK